MYYGGEAVGDAPSEVPRLEDFLSARRASSPPPPSCAVVETMGSSLGATTGHCYYDEEQKAAGGEALGAKPGKSSPDEDSKSDNGNRLSQSGRSFDGAAGISLTCAHPVAAVALPPGGDVSEDGKSTGTALLGTGQRSSSYRGVTRQVHVHPSQILSWTCHRHGACEAMLLRSDCCSSLHAPFLSPGTDGRGGTRRTCGTTPACGRA